MTLREVIERAYDGGPAAIEEALTASYVVIPKSAIRKIEPKEEP